MIAWLIANGGTILLTIVLILIIAFIIHSIIRDKKQGKSTCGGDCAHCGACSCAHTKKNNQL
ncbi:MAG: FeoB-associated Cys-rich membrane protein [Eubacterium sp.]|nr:FeoB-associated Cys-rich membrane protein [Eubacterium sp.]